MFNGHFIGKTKKNHSGFEMAIYLLSIAIIFHYEIFS